MGSHIVSYIDESSTTGPSREVWHDCPVLDMLYDPSVGYYFFDDFLHFGVTPTITTLIAGLNGYTLFGSAGATILPDDAAGGGIVLTEATDNEAVSISMEQHPFWINTSYGNLWFEARIKTSTITTAQQGWVCGLMDTTAMTAAIPVTATGTIADVNFVGFHLAPTPGAEPYFGDFFSSSPAHDGQKIFILNNASGDWEEVMELQEPGGFEPTILFAEGLEKSIDWYRQNLV